MIVDVLGLGLVNALWLAAGCGVTAVAGWSRDRGLLGSLGVSYLAGVAAYGVVAQLLLILGLGMSRLEIAVVCALLCTGVAVRRRTAGRLPRPGPAGVAILAVLALLAVDLWFQPLWAYDAWTFWTPKAHALAALGGLDARWFSQPELLNRDYPLLLPAVEAAGFRFTGYETSLLDLQSWLFVCGLLLAFAELVRPRAPRWAVVIPLLVVVAPSLADQLASAEADIPLAAFFACAAAMAFLWWREAEPGALVLFGVFCAGVVATKAEGLPFVIVLALVFTAATVRRSRRAAALLACTGAAAVVAGVGPWRVWVDHHHIPQQASLGRATDTTLLSDQANRVPVAARYLLERLFDPRAWLLLVPLLVCLTAVVWLRGKRDAALVISALVGLCLLGLIGAYWTSQFEIHYHLATSARRVITGPILAWAFLVPLALAPDAHP
ncbi:MAG: hypothetical protein ACXVZ4_07710 [Gaiellaceae bacterium]